MSNKCNCPNPPGGTVTCGDDQIAYCYVKYGTVFSGCYASSSKNGTVAAEQFLKKIIRRKDLIPYQKDILTQLEQVIEAKNFRSRDGNFELNFR